MTKRTYKPRNRLNWLQAWRLYDLLPMKQSKKLPDEGFAERMIELTPGYQFPVYCKPKPAAGVRWGHRVMVHCWCGRHIPFGRMTQHFDAVECVRDD